jgi:hypothetical protein
VEEFQSFREQSQWHEGALRAAIKANFPAAPEAAARAAAVAAMSTTTAAAAAAATAAALAGSNHLLRRGTKQSADVARHGAGAIDNAAVATAANQPEP